MQEFGMRVAAESSDVRFAGSYGADMYADTIEGFAKVAEKKLAALRQSPGGFFVSSMLAGAYVGNHPATVSVGGFAWNMLWVTLGNIVGGAVFVAGAYQVSTHGFPVPAAPGEKVLRPVTAEAVVEPLRRTG